MIEVDARGLSCPIPVVRTKKTIDENPEVQIAVLVDSKVSRENVSRLAESKGYTVKIELTSGEYRLLLTPRGK